MKAWTEVAALKTVDALGSKVWLQKDGSVAPNRENARIFGTVTDACIHRDRLVSDGSTFHFFPEMFGTMV